MARAPKRRVDNVSSICGASGEHARIRDVFELPPSDWQPGHARRCTPHGPVRPHNGCRRAPMVAARTRWVATYGAVLRHEALQLYRSLLLGRTSQSRRVSFESRYGM